jgi:hypothetical protein
MLVHPLLFSHTAIVHEFCKTALVNEKLSILNDSEPDWGLELAFNFTVLSPRWECKAVLTCTLPQVGVYSCAYHVLSHR